MSAPSKIHTTQLVKIQPDERLAATSELNPSTQVLVTGCCEARGMGYCAATQVKVPATEISIVLEADVVHLTEGNKTGLITYLTDREVSSEEPDEGKPQVRFCEGAHSNIGAITPVGGAL